MRDSSPNVPRETHVSRVPIFFSKKSVSLHEKSAPPAFKNIQIANRSLSEGSTYKKPCQCPNVLVADDDPFEKLYYQMLFKQLDDDEEPQIQKKDLKIQVFTSGEDLLKKYNKLSRCTCGGQALIITDYNMGEENLNGIDIALNLRRNGYKGVIALRTSEEREFLRKTHKDLDDLLSQKVIDCFLEKDSHAKTRETVQKILRAS